MQAIRLRSRLLLMILPLVVAALLLSGVLASLESRVALTRVANRHLAFKAEQLDNYFESEWKVLAQLGLEKDPAYRAALESSFRSYAASLLRSETELIVAFDDQGATVVQIGLAPPSSSAAPTDSAPAVKLAPGWFNQKLLGEDRVGVAFAMEPLGWIAAVTEVQSAFFSDVRTMEYEQGAVLVGSVLLAAVFISVFVGYVLRPAERLTATIERISATNDLASRAQIEFGDEIGTLAREFNLMVSNLQVNYKRLEETSLAESMARHLAMEREEETLFLLGKVSDYRDVETGAHLRRIGSLSALLARLLGMDEEQQNLMRNSAPLHDIGKLAVPESILLKPGKLSTEEYERMKRHAVFGYELLKESRSVFLIEGAKIALSHHERWDGTGYPAGLKGEEIPLSGRIVGIVDVLDALTSARSYKEAWSLQSVRDFIADQRGKQFDPRLVDTVLGHFEDFEKYIEASAGPGREAGSTAAPPASL